MRLKGKLTYIGTVCFMIVLTLIGCADNGTDTALAKTASISVGADLATDKAVDPAVQGESLPGLS